MIKPSQIRPRTGLKIKQKQYTKGSYELKIKQLNPSSIWEMDYDETKHEVGKYE